MVFAWVDWFVNQVIQFVSSDEIWMLYDVIVPVTCLSAVVEFYKLDALFAN
jgi:hypothetical protein